MGETLAGLTLIRAVNSCSAPRLLVKAWAAAVTRLATGVVLALALESAWVVLVTPPTTHLGMPMANTASTDADVFDTVVIPACDSGISLGLRDKVAEQGVGAEEVQADVGSLCKVLQHR